MIALKRRERGESWETLAAPRPRTCAPKARTPASQATTGLTKPAQQLAELLARPLKPTTRFQYALKDRVKCYSSFASLSGCSGDPKVVLCWQYQ